MKKFIAVAAILSVMFLGAGPSYALVGMPDDVPGTNILQPFFLVDMAGYATDEGLDTLIVITDVSGITRGGYLDLVIRDKKSEHRGDEVIYYTPNDVAAYSARDILKKCVGSNDLVHFEYDLDGDLVNDTYIGYIEWTGLRTDATVDNLMAQVYLVDLANGRAAGTNAPAREYAPTLDGYDSMQNNNTNFEVFTGNALAMSDYREREDGANVPPTNNLTLTPRWFLNDADATNYLLIWTSQNNGVVLDPLTPDVYEVIANLYDADENGISTNLNLPYQLNIIDVFEELPLSWQNVVLGGWFEIPGTDEAVTLGAEVEWLAYSYQMAESASAGLNWSGLFDAHRNVGDFSTH